MKVKEAAAKKNKQVLKMFVRRTYSNACLNSTGESLGTQSSV